MLKAITQPETFERDGKQFTRQQLTRGTTKINLIRPVLSPEEYEVRRQAIEKAAIELLKTTIKQESTIGGEKWISEKAIAQYRDG